MYWCLYFCVSKASFLISYFIYNKLFSYFYLHHLFQSYICILVSWLNGPGFSGAQAFSRWLIWPRHHSEMKDKSLEMLVFGLQPQNNGLSLLPSQPSCLCVTYTFLVKVRVIHPTQKPTNQGFWSNPTTVKPRWGHLSITGILTQTHLYTHMNT